MEIQNISIGVMRRIGKRLAGVTYLPEAGITPRLRIYFQQRNAVEENIQAFFWFES